MLNKTKLRQWLANIYRFSLRLLPPRCICKNTSVSQGSVLMCYTTHPFRSRKTESMHANYWEANTWARLFSEYGYDVWVVDYRTLYPVCYEKYSILFGFGDVFERSFYGDFKGVRIFHATSADSYYQNHAEITRILDIKKRKNIQLVPRRTVDRVWAASTSLADGITCIGNDWTASTFRNFSGPLYKLPVAHIAKWEQAAVSNENKRGFLWFAGAGAAHKGLDLFLEAAAKMPPDCQFYIGGAITHETDFLAAYHEFLTKKNIHYFGFMDVGSEAMKTVLQACQFVVLPSCSEGMASSVITCMYSGLIPLVTKETGVDVHDYGILIKGLSVEETFAAMKNALSLSKEEIKGRSERAAEHVKTHHNHSAVEAKMREAFERLLR